MPSNLNKVASAARTATGHSGVLTVGDSGEADRISLGVNVTAVSGSTPTLDLTVEWLISDTPRSVGDATYDETGGGVEDEWTLASHGLQVGDAVQFTAVGTGATGYAVDTTYYVAEVPGVNTFTLAATLGGSAIEGTDDSVGTWTIADLYTYQASSAAPDDFAPSSSDTAFAQITAVGTALESFRTRSDAYRIVWTIGGTTPSFTFTVAEHAT